jgi:hypothetical protein
MEDWERAAIEGLFPKVRDSRIVLSLCPTGAPDAKWCLETGAAIWYGKPIVVVAEREERVPPGLRRVAHAVVLANLSTQEGREALHLALTALAEEFKDGPPEGAGDE